jgi:uncharacterized membrane protein YqaE (UPF0057 family)
MKGKTIKKLPYMKCKNILLFTLALVIFASCSRNDSSSAFSKRKYLDFHANKSDVKRSPVAQENNEELKIVSVVSEKPSEYKAGEMPVTASNEMAIQPVPITDLNFASSFKDSKPEVKASPVKNEVKLSFREIKRELKKAKHSANSVSETDKVLLIILAILLPPLAVYLKDGIGTTFWIDLVLTLLFFIPGVIYALLIVLDAI